MTTAKDEIVFGVEDHEVHQAHFEHFLKLEQLTTKQLIERFTFLKYENEQLIKSKRHRGNPAVLGLAGFGLTTLMLQFNNCGWMGIGPVIWLGFIFGGGAQLIAGFMEFNTGNNFGFCAFSTYGAFWISFALMLIGNNASIYTSNATDIAFFLLSFTFMTTIFWGASLKMNWGLFAIFTLLDIGLILLDISHFANVAVLNIVAGYILIACAISAWYVMTHIIYFEAYKRDVFPVGAAPWDAMCGRRKKQKELLD